MNTNFKSTSKSCLQSYILPSLTGLRATLLPSGGRRGWGRVCFFLLSLLLFAACSSDNDEQVQQPQPEKSYPLTIEVTENPMTGDGENSSNRAAITDNSSLNGFNMYFVYGDPITSGERTAIKNGDGKWTSGSWPDGSASINWYAYTDGTFQLNGGNPYINFTVDEDVAQQKDLLVATTTASFTDNGGKLTFNFDHACTALRFWFKKSTNMSGYKLEIKEVVLCNVVKQAKYYYASGWDDPYSDRSVYTLYSGSTTTLGHADYIPMDGGTPSYLFLIPQTLTAWDTSTAIASATTQTYLKIKCTVTNTSTSPSTVIHNDTYAYIPFAATLAAGQKYDVKINIGKNSLYSGPGTKIIP